MRRVGLSEIISFQPLQTSNYQMDLTLKPTQVSEDLAEKQTTKTCATMETVEDPVDIGTTDVTRPKELLTVSNKSATISSEAYIPNCSSVKVQVGPGSLEENRRISCAHGVSQPVLRLVRQGDRSELLVFCVQCAMPVILRLMNI
jgi:hypothetical protein